MERQRSVSAYRGIDLLLWAAILVIFEGIIIHAGRSILYAALAGAVYCLMGGGSREQLLIYAGGNLLSLAVVPLMNRIGKETLRETAFRCLGISLLTVLLMQAGRAIIALLLGASPAEAFRFFTTDALSAVFTLVIVWIVRRLDGVYEDQRHYLRRFHQEEEKERMERL